MKVLHTPYEVSVNREGTFTVFLPTDRRPIHGGAPVWLEVAGPFLTRELAENEARKIHRERH